MFGKHANDVRLCCHSAMGWMCVAVVVDRGRIAVPFIFMLFYDPIKSHNTKIKTTFMRTNFICCRRWCWCRLLHTTFCVKCMQFVPPASPHNCRWYGVVTGRMLNAYALFVSLLVFVPFQCSAIHLLSHRPGHSADSAASSTTSSLSPAFMCDIFHCACIQFHQWLLLLDH